jgi:hypothetical protein
MAQIDNSQEPGAVTVDPHAALILALVEGKLAAAYAQVVATTQISESQPSAEGVTRVSPSANFGL